MVGNLIGAAIGGGVSLYNANQAKKSQDRADRTYTARVGEGLNRSEGYYNEGRNDLQPFAQSGQQYGGLIGNIAGLNGASGQADALSLYQSSPSAALLKSTQDEEARRFTNRFAAGGNANSGRLAEELAARNSGLALQDFGNYQGLLTNMYGAGANAAGASANLAANRGNTVLGAYAGMGATGAMTEANKGMIGAAGMNSAGNYLGQALGKTDFSKMFKFSGSNVYPGSNPYSSSMLNTPGFYGNY